MDVSTEEVVLQLAEPVHRLAVEVTSLSEPNDPVHHLTVEDTSLYQPDSQGSSTETSSGNDLPTSSLTTKRELLNDFLSSCDAVTIGPYKRRWELSSVRTKANHISKAKSMIVAGPHVITPGDAGYLWEALRKSGAVENIAQNAATHPGLKCGVRARFQV